MLSEAPEVRHCVYASFEAKKHPDQPRFNGGGMTQNTDQDIVNAIHKTLDDMFLRLFCMGSEKSEIERFKEKSISSIIEIKKNLGQLGLKFKDESQD